MYTEKENMGLEFSKDQPLHAKQKKPNRKKYRHLRRRRPQYDSHDIYGDALRINSIKSRDDGAGVYHYHGERSPDFWRSVNRFKEKNAMKKQEKLNRK